MFGTLSFSDGKTSATFRNRAYFLDDNGQVSRRSACQQCRLAKLKCSRDKQGCSRCIALKMNCKYTGSSHQPSLRVPGSQSLSRSNRNSPTQDSSQKSSRQTATSQTEEHHQVSVMEPNGDGTTSGDSTQDLLRPFSNNAEAQKALEKPSSRCIDQTYILDAPYGPGCLSTALLNDSAEIPGIVNTSTDRESSHPLGDIDWTLYINGHDPFTSEIDLHGGERQTLPALNVSNDLKSGLSVAGGPSNLTPPTCPSLGYSSNTFSASSTSLDCECIQNLAPCLYRLNDADVRADSSIRLRSLQSIFDAQTVLLELAVRLKTCPFGCTDRHETMTMLVVCTQHLADLYAEITLQYQDTMQSRESSMRSQLPVVVGDYLVDNQLDRHSLISFLFLKKIGQFKAYMLELQKEFDDEPGLESFRGRVAKGLKSLGECMYRLGDNVQDTIATSSIMS